MVLREGTSIEVHRLFSPTPNGRQRFIEFFTANIRNPNTRKAYAKAASEFAEWCESIGCKTFRRCM